MQHVDNFVLRSEKKRRGDRMKAVFMTDKGRVRSRNEDNGGVFLNHGGNRLAIVADGMGGHRAGDVASEMTTTQLKDVWETTHTITTAEQAESWLRNQILTVNNLLFEHAKSNVECDGMGTTIVAAVCTDGFATVAHIGDSRCYILNDSGFQQLTDDHSLVNELLRSGRISKEEAEHHPRKNVLLRSLGMEENMGMDIKTIMFEEGDVLLICSDGLSNKVSNKEMEKILSSEDELEQQASKLINLANEYGGEDNISLAIVTFPRDGEGDE